MVPIKTQGIISLRSLNEKNSIDRNYRVIKALNQF